MKYEKLELEFIGDVAVIRLNDPRILNAVTMRMIADIGDALDEVSSSSRAMILTGTGRAFCAGASLEGDLGAIDEDGVNDAGKVLETAINPLMSRLRSLPIPWISAVRGAAAGVGCAFALAADLVIASESAYFMQAFARIGLVPDGGSSWLLSRGVSRVRAMEMMLLGERLPALKAMEWGLVNRLTSEDALDATASELARALASGPTRSLAMIRELAWTAADADWEEALATERRLQRGAGITEDHREGVAAFLEKRSARFRGV